MEKINRVFNVYKVEVGVLLERDNDEYECYNEVYDKGHSFFDENVAFFMTKAEAEAYADRYVAEGVDRTYGIVSELLYNGDSLGLTDKQVETDIEFLKESGLLASNDYGDVWYDEELYGTDNVTYSTCKIDGVTMTGFVKAD